MNRARSSTGTFGLPSTTAFRAVRWLVGAYAVLSLLTLAAIALFSAVAPSLVTPPAQVRGVIVAATSALTFGFAHRAARGDPRALLRLRIVVAVILGAVVAVLLFVPLPSWMVVEQATCGVLLGATALLIFRPTPSQSPESPQSPQSPESPQLPESPATA